MSSNNPRLRGGAPRRNSPYPLGQFPDQLLLELGRQFVHRLSVGHGDITGDDLDACIEYNVPELEGQVRRVWAYVEGQHDESDYFWALELKDGTFGMLRGGHDYTGWD